MATKDSMKDLLMTASLRDRRCGQRDIAGPVRGGYDCVVVNDSMLGGMCRAAYGSGCD
jgi:hypothetical protein